MYTQIHNALYRQQQALLLLQELLEEEYALLRERKTAEVVAIEFSIHELIRQLAREKEGVIAMLQGGKVRDYAQMLPKEQGDALLTLFQNIDKAEQGASRQASTNAQLSLALLDQSQRLLQELHKQIIPKTAMTYGRRGAMGSHRPHATLISGRL